MNVWTVILTLLIIGGAGLVGLALIVIMMGGSRPEWPPMPDDWDGEL